MILFGSRASGRHHKTSDYDFLVIKKHVKNERKVSSKVYKTLFHEKIDASVDIIIVDKKKWGHSKDNPYSICAWALKEGRVMYG